MKRFMNVAALIALLAVFSTPAFAQADEAAAEESVDNSCFQIVGDSNFSFGTVDQNETVEHVFEFENKCDRMIHIDQVRASCGCTAAVLSEKDIKPGEKAKVNVKFTPPRMSTGTVTKTVSVYVQGDSRPHTVIRFTADVKSDLMMEPRYISLRGAEVGKEVKETATIKNMTDAPITITEPTISIYSYTDTSSAGSRPAVAIPLENASITPKSFTVEPGQGQGLTITFTPQYKGQINGNIRFKTEKSETWMQVYGVVRDAAEGDIRK